MQGGDANFSLHLLRALVFECMGLLNPGTQTLLQFCSAPILELLIAGLEAQRSQIAGSLNQQRPPGQAETISQTFDFRIQDSGYP